MVLRGVGVLKVNFRSDTMNDFDMKFSCRGYTVIPTSARGLALLLDMTLICQVLLEQG